jgi:hypothetical protein
LVDNEDYLNKVAYYIVLNPIKHDIIENIKDWEFTSYHQMDDKPSPDSKDILDDMEF